MPGQRNWTAYSEQLDLPEILIATNRIWINQWSFARELNPNWKSEQEGWRAANRTGRSQSAQHGSFTKNLKTQKEKSDNYRGTKGKGNRKDKYYRKPVKWCGVLEDWKLNFERGQKADHLGVVEPLRALEIGV